MMLSDEVEALSSASGSEGEEEEEEEEGSSQYEESGSSSGSGEEESEDEEEEEPVLKYRRFAKDVMASISEGGVQVYISCITTHSKVSSNTRKPESSPAHYCVCRSWCALIRTQTQHL